MKQYMGGRGAFVDVKNNDFRFVENGQTFITVGEIDGIEIIIRKKPYATNVPMYSHGENKIYAVVKNGKLKSLAYYDEFHCQARCVDFDHKHGTNHVVPHVHFYLNHNPEESGNPANFEDLKNAEKINNWLRNKI